jgi:cytochrome c peroxidase
MALIFFDGTPVDHWTAPFMCDMEHQEMNVSRLSNAIQCFNDTLPTPESQSLAFLLGKAC